ncbi:MAG: hypothetical protein N2Z21_08130 [Candidatus Sumerlaeaceae bacterium]|nr:hypothetical protein [Candidatus Sumerlaeaceae bacterium]
MVRTFVTAIFSFFLLTTAFAEDFAIVVESAPGGHNSEWFSTVEGNWMESASKSKAPGLQASKAMFKTAGSAGAARFTPDIPVEGEYEVFATYPDSGNAVGVIYHVHSASGDSDVVVDQRGRDERAKPRANTWFSLGKFKFAKGKEGYVEIRDPQTGKAANEKEPNVRIYADAVKFVPVGFALPPQFAVKVSPVSKEESAVAGLPATPVPAAAPQLPLPQPTASSSTPSLAGIPQTQQVSPVGGNTSLPPLIAASGPQDATPSLPALGSTGVGAPAVAMNQSLPALPTGEGVANNVSGVQSTGTPQLPVLGSAVPTPIAPGSAVPSLPSLPEAGTISTPVSGTPAALSAQPPALQPLSPVTDVAGTPSASPTSLQVSSEPASVGLSSLAPGNAQGSQQSPLQTPIATPSADGLLWIYDEGSAHAAARNQNKKVLVYFVADGNRICQKYETEYFKNPAVREALSQFVLRKVNFALNTKAAYKAKVYGAGCIAITDALGDAIGTITEIPATPEEFAQKLKELAAK